MGWESGIGVEADGFSQARLAVVKGPEAGGAQFEGAGNVEGVEGADSEGRAVTPREADGGFPRLMRKLYRVHRPERQSCWKFFHTF